MTMPDSHFAAQNPLHIQSVKSSPLCRMQANRGANGFTLTEIVLVLLLMAILATIAAGKYIDLQRDAQIAQLQRLAGELRSGLVQLNAAAQLPSRLQPLEQTKPNAPTHQVLLENGDGYHVTLTTDKALLDGGEVCHLLGISPTRYEKNQTPSAYLQQGYRCKFENDQSSYVALESLGNRCRLQFDPRNQQVKLSCPDKDQCVCP